MENRPWYKYYDGIPNSLNYPKTTLYERFKQTTERYPDAIAWEFLGSTGTYRELLADIDQFANGLASQGFNEGDYMTISMPTSPQGVIPIYAVNKLGGIAAMIHPLNPPAQIKMYLNITKSRWALTLDAFYNNFNEILSDTSVEKIIISKIPDYLGVAMSFGFWLTKGRKIPKIPKTDSRVINFMDLMKKDYPSAALVKKGTDDCAIILFSGGTTGEPKGIKLSNLNIISEGMMAGSWGKIGPGDRILAILPIFHGFGLGVCINGAFMMGSTSIMVPTFTPETVAELIKKKRPQIVIGVPTLYDALCNNPDFQKTDLSCLKICFSGADTLPRSTKEKFEEVVRNGGGNIKL
ncbi:MAG: AMP-binding protein, partial [Promethearchaeota archaeon]